METERMALARLPPIGSPQAENISPRQTNKYEGLSGPTYTIGGRPQKYTLPPPHKLRPYQDTKAGALDTWPAHATSHSAGKKGQVAIYEASADPPKPRFLEQLEAFLQKELKSLGVAEVRPNELRLQAHREVFEYLIEDFKTYKPLLSAVKNEYEMMLSFYRERVRELEPLKQMLVTVSEQCDQKIVDIRDQEKQEMIDLKNENKQLYGHIAELKQEQKALEMQVEQLQAEVAAEYLRYRDECDARKLLIADINDLRYQQEDMLMAKQSMEEITEEKEDPVLMKIALKAAREDIDKTTKRLLEIEANYGDVIPRRDFEALQKQYGVLDERFRAFKDDLVKLQQEHNTLLDVHKQVLQQRDDYYVESETLRRSATPRPEWEKCIDFIPGGEMRWQELSEGKTSDQLVDILLQELGGGASDSLGAEYFEGQGTGPAVPAFLRFEGKVRNRRLGKRDAALLIRDIWREKCVNDSGKTVENRDKMTDFLHEYLQRRFGLEQMVVEWGYNLQDACQRYQHDDTIGFFCKIIKNEVDEEIYHSNLMTIAKLLNAITKHDLEKGNQGALSKQEFEELLRGFLVGADDESIASLLNAASNEMEMAEDEVTIEYKNLFMEDDEGKTGPFLDELKNYLKNERLAFAEEIKTQLGTVSPVTPDELKAVIAAVDPEMEAAELERVTCFAFNVDSPDKYPECEAQEQSALVARLQQANLRKSKRS